MWDKIQKWFYKRELRRIVRQGNQYSKLLQHFRLLRAMAEGEYYEDNKSEIQGFLLDVFMDALPYYTCDKNTLVCLISGQDSKDASPKKGKSITVDAPQAKAWVAAVKEELEYWEEMAVAAQYSVMDRLEFWEYVLGRASCRIERAKALGR